MSRVSSIILSVLTACPMMTGFAAHAPRSPDGTGIPELTALFQTVNATTTSSTSYVSTLNSSACSGFGAVQGPDLVYSWLAQTGNPVLPLHLDFYVTPQTKGFDAVVYALSELDNGASCVAAIDFFGAGSQEMLHVEEQLIPGHRYYLYIDSRNGAAISGSFRLYVSTFVPVELQSFTIE